MYNRIVILSSGECGEEGFALCIHCVHDPSSIYPSRIGEVRPHPRPTHRRKQTMKRYWRINPSGDAPPTHQTIG